MSEEIRALARNPKVVALGATVVAFLAAFAILGQSASGGTAAQAQYAPRNTAPPTIAGTPADGQILTANNGTWTGDQPMTFEYQWQRCNSAGQNCVLIPNAKSQTYTATSADTGNTIRVAVTARNSQGASTVLSAQTAVVGKAAGPAGAIKLANGETSIPVTSVPSTERLVIDHVQFTPNPVRTRTQPIQVRIKIKDTRGFVVRDALVFLRSTPVVTSTQDNGRTGQDGTILYTVQPESDFPIRNGYNVQFFVKAYKQGDNPLAGIAGYRLVQVQTVR